MHYFKYQYVILYCSILENIKGGNENQKKEVNSDFRTFVYLMQRRRRRK